MAARRIVIIDDHPLFRDALKGALRPAFAELDVREASSLEEGNKALEDDPECDLVLLDLKMPGVQGLSGLAYFRAQYPSVPVAIVSGHEDPALMRRALSLGASGYVPKSTTADRMREAVSAILDGEVWMPAEARQPSDSEREIDDLARRLATLTPQQLRVLMMLREGLLNKQIAYELDVSEATVKAHVSAILQKLNVDSRTQAVIAAGRIDGDSTTDS
ncbi:MAG: response regulator transcription factor [Proteobacteria bacterium]|nr:response regulator transcription factor [Pseudomonadota bacterium]